MTPFDDPLTAFDSLSVSFDGDVMVLGPFFFEAATVFLSGADAGGSCLAGAEKGMTFVAGADAGEVDL